MDGSATRSFRLADAGIEAGHLCGLFAGPDDFYAQLTPFMVEGIEAGQRAVHIVGPADRSRHLDHLASAGIDVGACLRTGQLDVRTWPEVYLVDGRFEPDRVVRQVHTMLDEGRALGFPATRLIGAMEWALENVGGADLIVTYEARLEVQLRAIRDTIICAYDARRHRPGVILDMLSIHPLALVEGAVRQRETRRAPRDRILATAARLFHRRGVAATGIDLVIAEAGVAKATFYRSYRSKDDLILAWIRDPATRWFDAVFEWAERNAASADLVVPAVFDAVAEWLARDGFRGDPYLNTIAELADVDATHPVRAMAQRRLEEIRGRLSAIAGAAGADPTVGDRLYVLLAGAIQLAAAERSAAPMRAARDAAAELLRASRG